MNNHVSRRKFLFSLSTAIPAVGLATGCSPFRPEGNDIIRPNGTLADTDVLVVGGGPAGMGAALAAARMGVRTFLVEDCAFLGGVGAWGCGMQLNQMRPNGIPRSAIHELIIARLFSLGEQAGRFTRAVYFDGPDALMCNVEYLKVALMDALDEVGCTYLVHAKAVDVIKEENRVQGIVVATKRGLRTIKARIVVDCTGDADIAFFAGAETMTETGNLSPMTLCFNTTNVTEEDIQSGKDEYNRNIPLARQRFPLIHDEMPDLSQVANSHFYYTNHAGTRDLGQYDGTDPFQLSQAECLSRRQVVQMVEALRTFSGLRLRNIELSGSGPRIGIRESRRVVGSYILTETDALSGARFEDVVAWRSGNLDVGFVRVERMKVYDVPYRSLVPQSVEGLLMAGRCISATHVAASAGKSMGNCIATGHAAGVAAALSVTSDCMPREIRFWKIQERLKYDGVDLGFGGQDQPWLE